MQKQIGHSEAIARVKTFMESRGLKVREHGDNLQVSIDPGIFGYDVEIYVELQLRTDNVKFRCQVNWGTMGSRSVASAQAAITIMQEAVNHLALIEAFVERLPQIVYDLEE